MQKCIFLDRDGVINKDRVNYAYTLDTFHILDGVVEALQKLKEAGYVLVIITNQSGIAKGIYNKEDVFKCHKHLQEQCGNIIDDLYYAPYHPTVTESLTRKPDSLMLEKAIAKYNVDVTQSWMLGDKERDLVPAEKLGIPTILTNPPYEMDAGDYKASSLLEAVEKVILADR